MELYLGIIGALGFFYLLLMNIGNRMILKG